MREGLCGHVYSALTYTCVSGVELPNAFSKWPHSFYFPAINVLRGQVLYILNYTVFILIILWV